MASTPESSHTDSAGAPEDRTAPSVRVLIVDDQPCFREVARELLECRGYTVVGEAHDASSARDAVDRLAPDGVLLDIHLGEDCGLALARALSKTRPAPAVLLVSAEDHPRWEELVRDDHARGFVRKSRLASANLAEYWPGAIA